MASTPLILPLLDDGVANFRNTFRLIEDSFPIEAVSEGELSMAASSIAAFWVVSSLLIMVPGADWAYTIGAGLRGHARRSHHRRWSLPHVARGSDLSPALRAGGHTERPGRQRRPGAREHPGPHQPGHALERNRRQRAQPQGPAALPRPAPAVHQPAWALAARGPARCARGGLRAQLRDLLPLPG